MLLDDGFFDWAIRDPGPEANWAYFGYAKTPVSLITHHSLEGYASRASVEDGRYKVMSDPDRFPTAWHGTVVRDGFWSYDQQIPAGALLQHYPVWARLQHGNSANDKGPGFEAEDYASSDPNTRLTTAQEETYLRIHEDISAYYGRVYTRENGGLVEHREMTVPPGLTSCPSNIYDNLWARIAAGDTGNSMTAEQQARLKRVENIIGAWGWLSPEGSILKGDEALDAIEKLGVSLGLSAQYLNLRLLDTIARLETVEEQLAGVGQILHKDESVKP